MVRDTTPKHHDPNVVFFGTRSVFSVVVLRTLLERAIPVSGIVVAGTAPSSAPRDANFPLAVTRNDTVEGLAFLHRSPVSYVTSLRTPENLAAIASQSTDIIAVACFPYLLPAELLAIARIGALNLHPSLLPAYRGPAPLFWQFRAGAPSIGITLHWMNEQMDAGSIVAAKSLPLEAGATGADTNYQLAEIGAGLMFDALRKIRDGCPMPRRAQDESKRSYFPWPREEDFSISTEWPAERAYRFMRGTADWARPYRVRVGDDDISLARATDFSREQTPGDPHRRDGDIISIRCSPGVLTAKIAPRAHLGFLSSQ